jgi:predicted nucleic acid-binding protein
MIVISNTTPLRYLIAIRQEHLLAEFFTKIHIPAAVFEELTNPRTPGFVREHVSAQLTWLEVHLGIDSELRDFPRLTHRGEREAIALAAALNADLILMDEKNGRHFAASRNFKLSGTLGVLEMADSLQTNRRLSSDAKYVDGKRLLSEADAPGGAT